MARSIRRRTLGILKRPSWRSGIMAERLLVDTGAIIAVLVAEDKHHEWAKTVWEELEAPFYTCEAVLSESQFVIKRLGGNSRTVLELVRREALKVEFTLSGHIERLITLQMSYRDMPISLADACLVRMSELHERCRLLTTDS